MLKTSEEAEKSRRRTVSKAQKEADERGTPFFLLSFFLSFFFFFSLKIYISSSLNQ